MNGTTAVRAALVVAAFAIASPSRAAEDGQASLVSGLASTFGLTHSKDPNIDYRERSRLVIPRKMTLPPPVGSAKGGGAWPVDVEDVREQNVKKIEDAEPSAKDMTNHSYQLIHPGDTVKVTTSGFNGRGPSCRIPDPKTGECPEGPRGPAMNWNPMTWVGIEKKPKVVLGPEPERENLVDPPKGYRAPAEGVGAKVDN